MVIAINGWIGKIDINTISLSFFAMLSLESSIVIIRGAGIKFGVKISLGVAKQICWGDEIDLFKNGLCSTFYIVNACAQVAFW